MSCCWRHAQAVIICHWHLPFSPDEAVAAPSAAHAGHWSFHPSVSAGAATIWYIQTSQVNAIELGRDTKRWCALICVTRVHGDKRGESWVQAQKWLKAIKESRQRKSLRKEASVPDDKYSVSWVTGRSRHIELQCSSWEKITESFVWLSNIT